MGVRNLDERLAHLDMLKRALELRLRDDTRTAFEDMLEEMTTARSGRCAHAGSEWKLYSLSPAQERWVRKVLGEELPTPDVRLTLGGIPRGREVPTPPALQNLPKRPPGRA